MTEQLALVEIAPAVKLGDRQQLILHALQHAGQDGLHADEAGAQWCAHRRVHPAGERCQWCATTGLQALRSLRKHGLARYRSRLKIWQATGLTAKPADTEPPEKWNGTGPVPYGVIPY